jgi:thioredoxin-like negative regulator of GroEL
MMNENERLIAEAAACYQRGKFEEALSLSEQAIKQDSTNEKAYIGLYHLVHAPRFPSSFFYGLSCAFHYHK